MNFVSPLAKDKRIINVSGHLMDYQLGHDIDGADASGHKGSFSYVDQWSETFWCGAGPDLSGPTIAATRNQQLGLHKNTADQGDVNGDGIREAAPWGGKTATKLGDNQRTGAMTILEWQASEQLNLKYDLFYSEFDIEELEDQFWFDGWGNWGGGGNWNYNNSAAKPQIITKADGSQQLTGAACCGAHTQPITLPGSRPTNC